MAPHDHRHAHTHAHTHSHAHSADRAFAFGVALNGGYVVAEVVFGLAANSMALIADAAHNMGDVLGLLLGWTAAWLGRKPPTAQRTYGWARGSILAALSNSAFLLVSVGAIAVASLRRLLAPAPVAETTVIWVAAIGIIINGITAIPFLRGNRADLNIRAAFLHLAADAGVSLCVVVAGLVMVLTGNTWLDPAASLAIAAVILVSAWGVLRDSANLALDAVPPGVKREAIEAYLAGVTGVVAVHDLHIWALSTTETALTVHVVVPAGAAEADRILGEIEPSLHKEFGIDHCTIQFETPIYAEVCRLRPADTR